MVRVASIVFVEEIANPPYEMEMTEMGMLKSKIPRNYGRLIVTLILSPALIKGVKSDP